MSIKSTKLLHMPLLRTRILRSEIRYAQAKVLVKLNRQSEAIKCLQSFYQNANFSLIPVALLSDIGELLFIMGGNVLRPALKIPQLMLNLHLSGTESAMIFTLHI